MCADMSLIVADIKQASVDHAPFQAEETWVQSVAEANHSVGETDPTIANAGLTESGIPANGVASDPHSYPADTTGNTAGERWASAAPGEETSTMEDSFEMVPRPAEEVENTEMVGATEGNQSWADTHQASNTGKISGEGWGAPSTGVIPARMNGSDGPAAKGQRAEGEGFHQVAGGYRGRGGRGRGGEGEMRGRGRGRGNGPRGDGGRGRGGGRGGGRGVDGGRGRGRGGHRGGSDAA